MQFFHAISVVFFTPLESNQKILFRPSFKRYVKRIITCCMDTVVGKSYVLVFYSITNRRIYVQFHMRFVPFKSDDTYYEYFGYVFMDFGVPNVLK